MRKTFSGLMSRWTMPFAVRGARARVRDLHQDVARALAAHRAVLLERCARSWPSRNSIAKNTEPVGDLAEVGDVDDVLVADARGRSWPPAGSARPGRAWRVEVLGEDLERDRLLDQHVLGLIDGAHAAFADLARSRDSDRRSWCRHTGRPVPDAGGRFDRRRFRFDRRELVAGFCASAACMPDWRVTMPGAATVSLKRGCAGLGVMRGCEPVAITRGCGGGCGEPGTRGWVVLGTFGGGGFGLSSFATVRSPRLAPPKEAAFSA